MDMGGEPPEITVAPKNVDKLLVCCRRKKCGVGLRIGSGKMNEE